METFIRRMTVAAVLAVAAFAAVVSWQHIFDLARTHGQSELAAALIPLSVDGECFGKRPRLALVRAPAGPQPGAWSRDAVLRCRNDDLGQPGLWPSLWLLRRHALGLARLCLCRDRRTRLDDGQSRRTAADIEAGPEDGPMPALHRVFSDQIARREVPSIRAIKTALGCGQTRASRSRPILSCWPTP